MSKHIPTFCSRGQLSPKSTSGEQLETEFPQPTHLQERKPTSSKSGWRSFIWRQLSSLLFQGQRSPSRQRLPQAGSAASRGTKSHPNRCRRPHPLPGSASRPARDRGPRGIPASLCGRRASRRRPAGVGVSSGARDPPEQRDAARLGTA